MAQRPLNAPYGLTVGSNLLANTSVFANGRIQSDEFTFTDGSNLLGNFSLVDNTIYVSNANGEITLQPDSNGNVYIGGLGQSNPLIARGNIVAAGNVTATGNVHAAYFIGDGSQLTGLAPQIQTYVFSNVASDISTYYSMPALAAWTAGTIAIANTSVTTSATLLGSFATPNGFPNLTKIPIGSFYVNFETQRTSPNPGTTYYCYAEIYKRSSGGTETLLATTDNTDTTTSTQILQQVTAKLNNSIISLLASDRIVVKIYAVASASCTIALRWDDNTNSLFSLPAPSADAATFVPYSGATALLNMGTYGVTTTGNVTAGNLVTTNGTVINSGVTTTGNITATGNVSANNISLTGVGVTMSNRPAFRVYGNTSTAYGVGTTIVNQVVDYNQGNNYVNSTGLFTAPIAGLYQCFATLRVGTNNGLNQASIQKNSSGSGANVISFWETDTNTNTATHFSMAGMAKLAVGDTVRLYVVAGNINFDANDSWSVTFIG